VTHGVTCRAALRDGVWRANPVTVQMLGICSALAVTSRLANALAMGLCLTVVCVGTNVTVSLLRRRMPLRIRLIIETMIIATLVISLDQLLQAFFWDLSKQLGPYVGLIITNCIILGRAEAFAAHRPPFPAAVDGLAHGLGYAAVLGAVGLLRELLGSGRVLGYVVVGPEVYTPNQLFAMTPGAFFVLGFIVAAYQLCRRGQGEGCR